MTEKRTPDQETQTKETNLNNPYANMTEADINLYRRMRTGAIIVALAILAVLLSRVPANKRDAEYAAIEKQVNARRDSLNHEQTQALIEHQIRCAAALDAYRRTQDGILKTYFVSDRDRNIAIETLQISYVKHRRELDDKYNNTRDSLNNLYRRENRRLDEAHKRIYGKSK